VCQEAEAARREAEAARGREAGVVQQVGVESCDNQMVKKRLRQSCEAKVAAAQQQRQRNNQLANKRQMGGEAYKRQTGGEASVDKRRRSAERTRGGGSAT
jgi:hypothetical protein